MAPRIVTRVAASLVALALAAAPAIAGPWLLAPGEFYSELQASTFDANTFRNDDGSRVPIGGEIEQRQLVSMNELGWKNWMSVMIAIPATSLTQRNGTGTFERTETGLSDLVAGLRFKLTSGPTAVALEGEWKAPLGYNRNLSPRLGDGQQDLTGTLHFGTGFPAVNAFLELEGGYRHRLEAPADQYVGGASLGFWVGSLLVAGRYDGAIATGEGTVPTDEVDLHRVGPEFRWRVDESLDVVAGSRHSAAGRNVLHSDAFYVGVAARRTRLDRLQGFLGGAHRP